jgi:hypothetical protein
VKSWSFMALVSMLLLTPRPGQAAGAEVAAAWKRHDIEFVYMGFTTRYSCEGLRDKVRLLLQAGGARADFKVTTRSCAAGPGQVTEFPRVSIVFFAAEIPSVGSREAGDPTLARWREVSLSRRNPRDLEIGDCELIEQFRDRVLPRFTTRNLGGDINCVPHQLSGSSFKLEYEVLVGLQPADAASPTR